jgi:SAM-dependent methyltransferase
VQFDRKTVVVADLIRSQLGVTPSRILVVGCGTGREAAQLAVSFNASVVGIDIEPRFDNAAGQVATLQRGDATALDFPDGAFDFVYSYHALEHIPDFRRALSEMRRVLTKGGSYCIGTPNRHRLVGYLGSDNATLRDKFRWNALDWKARLRGRFRNEFGEHAGFTRTELERELNAGLGPATNVTLPYYLTLYSRRKQFVRMLDRLHVSTLLFPAIYFVGRRAEARVAGVARAHSQVAASA